MRIEVDKESLLKSINIADSIITSKQINTILSNCLLNVSRDEITIISTDNEIGIRTKLSVISDSEDSFTVYGKKLSGILKELPSGGIIIDVSKDFLIDIKTKEGKVKGHYTLIGTDSGDFPDIPVYGDEDIVEIEQPILKEIIRRVVYAAATDTIKPIFNSVYLLSEEAGKMTAVATDSRRLSMTTMSMSNDIDLKEGVIIPLKTVNEVFRLLNPSGVCRFFVGKNQCFFQIGDTEVISRVVDGSFPNYKQVVPKENKIRAIVQREKILESLRRAMIFTREPANKIVMYFKNDYLKIEAKTPDLGEAEEELAIETDGEDEISIGINAHFLIESIREIDSSSVVLGITGERSPVTVRPDDEEDFISVIMPIQIKSSSDE
jgi:DNA polymerase-3 subunit beta